jgi:hypothetical protein
MEIFKRFEKNFKKDGFTEYEKMNINNILYFYNLHFKNTLTQQEGYEYIENKLINIYFKKIQIGRRTKEYYKEVYNKEIYEITEKEMIKKINNLIKD